MRVYAISAIAVAATPLVLTEAQSGPAQRGIIPKPPVAGLTAKPPRLSIVVLPFANLSSDPEQEYFVDAITDDLTTDLSRISGSFVIARTTAFTYKGNPIDVRKLGRELGVRYVLEGSVRRLGEQIQVNVQLIDAETGAHLWVDRFDTGRSNLAKAQSAITSRLARTLQTRARRGRRPPNRAGTTSGCRRARSGHARLGLVLAAFICDKPEQAQRDFEKALEIDPESADARVGIATVLGEAGPQVGANRVTRISHAASN